MNINTLIHELAQTRDPMNDYTPRAIWVDTFTGTYGGVDSLAIIDITAWSEDDDDTWDTMSDSQRNNYALGYKCCDGDYHTPTEWIEKYVTANEKCCLCGTTNANADIQERVCDKCYADMPVEQWVSGRYAQ